MPADRPATEPRTEALDGPTTRKPTGTPFSSWTILHADDVDGVRWYFHVPTAALAEAAQGAAPLTEEYVDALVRRVADEHYRAGVKEGRRLRK